MTAKEPHIRYTPKADVSPKLERALLGNVFRYVLDAHAKRKAAEGSGGKDGERKDQHALTEAQYTG